MKPSKKSWRCSWLKTKKTYCAHWEPSVNLLQQRARSRKRLQTVMTMSLSTTLPNQENRCSTQRFFIC
ncbi:Uncharacterised protein [Vibrio cholerae]|nr:Uncharacterised protein [Vibrio cholerae]